MAYYISHVESGAFILDEEYLMNRNASYPLLCAIEKNDIEVFRSLINDSSVDVSVTNPEFDETALHLAMAVGNEEMVRELLSRGANVLAVTQYSLTVLHYLGMNSASVPCAKLIMEAAQTGFATEKHTLINALTRNSAGTALSLAAFRNKKDLVIFLLDHGARIQGIADNGLFMQDSMAAAVEWFNPFCRGINFFKPSPQEIDDQAFIMRAMITCGANVTLYHVEQGVLTQSVTCVQILLNALPETFDINTATFEGRDLTVLQLACSWPPYKKRSPPLELIQYLVTERGANVNIGPGLPRPVAPIVLAAQRKGNNVVDFLIKHGATWDGSCTLLELI